MRRLAALARIRARPQRRDIGTLILLRHGQSIWNGTTATFTGWCDVALTPLGRSQATEAGELLKERGYGPKIDVQVTDFSALSFHGQAQAVHQMGLQTAFLAPETSEL